METTRRSLKAIAGLVTAVAVAIGVLVGFSQPGHAANGTGYYGSWIASGSPGSGTVSVQTPGFPSATVTSTGALGTSSGVSSWLPAWTGMGTTYGSSENNSYLNVSTPALGATATITFATPTPASGWSFAFGDIDAEAVTVSAKDANGANVPVQSWFNSVFNYCENAPRASGCGGAQTDTPTWNGIDTVTGNVADSTGAAAWFTPNRAIKSLTFTSADLSGLPQYQVWLASDTTLPVVAPCPLTVKAKSASAKLTRKGNTTVVTSAATSSDCEIRTSGKSATVKVRCSTSAGTRGDLVYCRYAVNKAGKVIVKTYGYPGVRVKVTIAAVPKAGSVVTKSTTWQRQWKVR